MGDTHQVVKRGNKWATSTGKVYKPLNMQIINAGKLKNAVYQREINPSKVKNIVNNFRLESVNPIKVSLRDDGSYYVIDGQHTYMAITQLFGDDVDLACVVVNKQSKDWSELDSEQFEARVFAHQHDNTKKLSVNEKFNASVIGKEYRETHLLSVCEQNGFNLNYRDGQTASDNTPVCTSTMLNIYDRDNGKLLDTTLKVIRKAYDGRADALQSQFIKAISTFIIRHEEHVNFTLDKFAVALSKYVNEPLDFVNKARYNSDFSKQKYGRKESLDRCAEMMLIDIYNKNKAQANRILLG